MNLIEMNANILNSEKSRMAAAVFGMIFIFGFSALDMWDDYREGSTGTHLLIEIVVFLICIFGVFVLIRNYLQISNELKKLLKNTQSQDDEIARWKSEAQKWQAESKKFLSGLGNLIDLQFGDWKLTLAEKEIGLLLLKGFSYKEIGEFRKTKEGTVRQQAMEIYHKGGFKIRAEFAAFFLEDLLLPSVGK